MEGETHRRMRENLKEALANSEFEVKTSHEKDGKINLYHGKEVPENWLSDVDLVLLRNGAMRGLIEIKDKDITPKVILGTIGATDLASKCVVGKDKPREIKDATLFIVVNSRAFQGGGKRKSRKPGQLKLIEQLMRKRLGKGCIVNLEIFEFDQDEKDFEELKNRLKFLL